MEVDHRELARRLGIAVRHRHDGRLLQAEQVTQLVLGRERIHQRQLSGAGISEHDLDAFLLEQIEEGAFSGHDGQDVLPGLGGQRWCRTRNSSQTMGSISQRLTMKIYATPKPIVAKISSLIK